MRLQVRGAMICTSYLFHLYQHQRFLLETEDDTAGIAEAILVISEVAGEAGREGIGRVELGSDEIHLGRADCNMFTQPDIYATTECHGECIRAGHAR